MENRQYSIVHLVQDEKFIDMAFQTFEKVFPEQNECIVLSESQDLLYIKSTPCSLINVHHEGYQDLVQKLTEYDVVILHSLSHIQIEVLKHLPKHVVTVWLGFGFDYYDLIYQDKTSLYDVKTKALFLKHNPEYKIESNSTSFLKDEKFWFVRKLKRFKRLITGVQSKQDVINNINFFSPVIETEYQILNQAMYGELKPRFLDWNYGNLEDNYIKGFENVSITSNSILVGNSAHLTSNHLDTFDVLKRLEVTGRRVIAPLSYGGEEYLDEIIFEGEKLFGDDFVPLVDFMPIDKYIEIISSCSVLIMNHVRQQAVGNIVTMMYLGAAIFLKEKNPVYSFFKEREAIVFTIEELETDGTLINVRLSNNEIEQNRKVLRQYWSREVILGKTRNLITQAT